MGQLLAIAYREKKRGDMKMLDATSVTLAGGIHHDFRGKPGKRQVTVLSKESWQTACAELNTSLPWFTRRANLLITGIDLRDTINQTLEIGSAKLRITQETDPCKRMEEAYPGLEKILAKDWRGGVCCQVISEGNIHVGDDIRLTHAE